MSADRLAIPPECAGLRLDVALARLVPGMARARVQRLVEDGRVRVDGRPAKASARLRGGEVVELEIPPPEPSGLVAQDLPLAILFEDRDLLVLDKAAGMVVHPARGSPHSTVVNALLHHFMLGGPAGPPGRSNAPPSATPVGGRSPPPPRSLRSGPGRSLPPLAAEHAQRESEARLGLVHRLDKDTSGCLVVAKTEAALAALQAQWKARGVDKVYLALCHGALADEGILDTAYGRHPKDRTRYTTKVRGDARRAITAWRARERFGDRATLAEVTLHTGRTHQIRVHLAEHGHPLVADAVYGGTRREARLAPDDPLARAAAAVGRQALHAWRLGFDHPRTGRRLSFEAPVPADLEAALAVLRAATPGAPSSARRPRSRGR